jgi:uncharacterized protein with ATP-grasp and redox domains
MRFYLDCYACLLRMTLDACRFSGVDEDRYPEIMRRMLQELLDADPAACPAEIAARPMELIRELTGCDDPYRQAKLASTREALALYPELKEMVSTSDDPFDTAIRLAIAGNIIDLGFSSHYDLQASIRRALERPLVIDHLERLRERVRDARSILYIGDNAGETVFDRLLIETIRKPVTYAVRGEPVLNDATLADAQEAGLDPVAALVSSGTSSPGAVLARCTPQFRDLFDRSDLIIAKGQGNYEALSEVVAELFFLLQVKCAVIARDLGADVGGMVVKSQRLSQAQSVKE